MLMRELLRWGEETLRQEKIGDAETDAWLCLEKVLGISRTCYYMKQDAIIEEEKERSYRQLILRRAGHTPVQQLLGEAWFAGLPFYVNDQVLIPRQDTEVLVEEAKKRLKSGDEILDLCTGSGCILLAILKSCEGIRGTGADLSENALLVAKENGERLGVPASWIRSDLFQNIEGKFNLITSNPPYIASEVIPGLMPEVRDHEPLLALDGGEDGLDFYRKIVSQAGAYLKKGGWLCLEIGYDQGQPLREMLLEAGYEEVEIIRDLAGLDRTAVGRRPQEERHV